MIEGWLYKWGSGGLVLAGVIYLVCKPIADGFLCSGVFFQNYSDKFRFWIYKSLQILFGLCSSISFSMLYIFMDQSFYTCNAIPKIQAPNTCPFQKSFTPEMQNHSPLNPPMLTVTSHNYLGRPITIISHTASNLYCEYKHPMGSSVTIADAITPVQFWLKPGVATP